MPGGRGSAIVVAGMAGAALLAGCGGGAHPPAGLSPTPVLTTAAPTPSPTAATTSAAPATSSAAAGPYPLTKEGAYALVKDFYAAEYEAAVKRDAKRFDGLTLSTCSCRRVDSYVKKLLAGHAHVDGEQIQNVKPLQYTASDVAAQLLVQFDEAAGKVVTSTGVVQEKDPHVTGIVDLLTLSVSDAQWIVKETSRYREGA